MSKFKVGDRVEWFSDSTDTTHKGTVESYPIDGSGLVRVKFDEFPNAQSHTEACFRPLDDAPKSYIVISRPVFNAHTQFTLEEAKAKAKAKAKDRTEGGRDYVVLGFTTGFTSQTVSHVEVVEVSK